jgi:hypothetical protein
MNYTYIKMKCSSVTLLVNLGGVGIIGPKFYTKAILANFFVRGKVFFKIDFKLYANGNRTTLQYA